MKILLTNDDGIFAIDGNTGEVTVLDNSNLDFETIISNIGYNNSA
jgi:broad specificity polyphosphatase/5'/3'-nucleotidase SurE